MAPAIAYMRGPRNLILLLFLALFPGSQTLAQSPKKASQMDFSSAADHAASLAKTGHCTEALPILKKSAPHLTDKPLIRRAGFAGVRCAMMLNQNDQAVDFLRWLNRELPHDPEVLYLSVHTYSDLSMRASGELLERAPASAQARELNAESLEVQGKWDDAEKEYRKILEHDPRLPGIHFRLGRLILSKPPTPTTSEDAKKEFERELEIDPKNAGAEYVLGELARQAQDLPEAIEHFTRAVRLDAGFADAFLALGTSLVSAKRYSDAISPLETAVKLEPENATGHYQLAISYSRVGRRQDAEREATIHKQLLEKAAQKQNQQIELPAAGSPPSNPPQ